MWDVFAVSTYGTVSALFWFIGLIPDFATLRDRARSKTFQIIYGMLAMGWRGSARHWHRYEMAYLLLAGLATPLVLSVHYDRQFRLCGRHDSRLARDDLSAVFRRWRDLRGICNGADARPFLSRKFYGCEDFITMRHIQNMAKVMLATGLIVAYGYIMEAFFGWYSGNIYERFMIYNRMTGPYWWVYWLLDPLQRPGAADHLVQAVPHKPGCALVHLSIIVSIGMWLERFVIIVTSLHRDFLPSSWGMYSPTAWDFSMFIGTIGLFFALLFLFIRFLPDYFDFRNADDPCRKRRLEEE